MVADLLSTRAARAPSGLNSTRPYPVHSRLRSVVCLGSVTLQIVTANVFGRPLTFGLRANNGHPEIPAQINCFPSGLNHRAGSAMDTARLVNFSRPVSASTNDRVARLPRPAQAM